MRGSSAGVTGAPCGLAFLHRALAVIEDIFRTEAHDFPPRPSSDDGLQAEETAAADDVSVSARPDVRQWAAEMEPAGGDPDYTVHDHPPPKSDQRINGRRHRFNPWAGDKSSSPLHWRPFGYGAGHSAEPGIPVFRSVSRQMVRDGGDDVDPLED
jgi:hypothetical protein